MAAKAIASRRERQFVRDVEIQELVTRNIVAAVHAAAGNRAGAKGADRIRFLQKKKGRRSEPVPVPTEWAKGQFVDPLFGEVPEVQIPNGH